MKTTRYASVFRKALAMQEKPPFVKIKIGSQPIFVTKGGFLNGYKQFSTYKIEL